MGVYQEPIVVDETNGIEPLYCTVALIVAVAYAAVVYEAAAFVSVLAAGLVAVGVLAFGAKLCLKIDARKMKKELC